MSVVSLLNEPNTYSPANVDASVMYRRWKDSKGKDKEYENIIRQGTVILSRFMCIPLMPNLPLTLHSPKDVLPATA